MLTTTESRLLRVLIALRDATGAKTRTPVSEDLVADLLRNDAAFDGSVADELDDLERQGFAVIDTDRSGGRRVQMTAPGKIKAEEFTQMMARAGIPLGTGTTPVPVPIPAPGAPLAATLHLRADPPDPAMPVPSPAVPLPAPGDDWSRTVGDLLDAVTQAVPLLPADTATVVSTLIEDARGAVSANSAARARRALASLGGFLGDAASGTLGNVLAAQMLTLASALGD
ncbi:MAG TPA: hypothetical protein VN107_04600 [Microbacterium sp.]|nr:hypothetical protein [Microbacterium sp.]